jgi:hypothetical protein
MTLPIGILDSIRNASQSQSFPGIDSTSISTLINLDNDAGKKQKKLLDEVLDLKDKVVSFRTDQGEDTLYPIFARFLVISSPLYAQCNRAAYSD